MTGETTFMRQISIFDPDQYYQYEVGIIGCGAIGSFVATTLAKLGLRRFTLWDKDEVKPHNLPNQFFKREHVGMQKVDALAEMMSTLAPNPEALSITKVMKKCLWWTKICTPIVFACVDSMKARTDILDRCVKNDVKLLIDTRMGGQVFEVYTVDITNEEQVAQYRQSLHSDEDAEQTPCTARSIIFNVLSVSSIAVNQLVKVFNNVDYKPEITGDLVNMMVK